MNSNLIGVGLYTIAEAARYSGIQARELRRWLFGYTQTSGRLSAPLWQTQLTQTGQSVIGFRDLMEVRLVKAFVDKGVSIRVIRTAIENARSVFNQDHPLTANRFLTDGASIFYEAAKHEENHGLTDLVKKQVVFESVIRPELYEGIEFSVEGNAKRWFPIPASKAVVLDPDLSFGKPVLTNYGISTDTIRSTFGAEGDKRTVAKIFDIPLQAVTMALRYEDRLAA